MLAKKQQGMNSKKLTLDELDDYLLNGEKEELNAFFEERKRKGLGVGLDKDGNIVYERDLKRV